MKNFKKLRRKISAIIVACALIISTTATNVCAIENPGVIQWRAGHYFIYLPTSPGDYTFERVGNALLNIKYPILGYATSLIKKSYSKPLTSSDIQKGEQTFKSLLKDNTLNAVSKNTCQTWYKARNLFGSVSEVFSTGSDLKKFKKNDTTNYALNYVLSTQVGLVSKSSLGAITQYKYASAVINPLIKSGDIKITWAKKWESTLRSKVSYSNRAKQQLNKLKKDLQIINKQFERNKIK